MTSCYIDSEWFPHPKEQTCKSIKGMHIPGTIFLAPVIDRFDRIYVPRNSVYIVVEPLQRLPKLFKPTPKTHFIEFGEGLNLAEHFYCGKLDPIREEKERKGIFYEYIGKRERVCISLLHLYKH